MSVMTWISLIGITLAVFALIATLAVRAGFRAEFVDTILGANAHVTVYSAGRVTETGQLVRGYEDYDALAARLAEVPGVTELRGPGLHRITPAVQQTLIDVSVPATMTPMCSAPSFVVRRTVSKPSFTSRVGQKK